MQHEVGRAVDNSTGTVTVVRTEVEPCHIKLDIEVPAEQTSKVFEEAVATVSRHARVPGFRAGKAPRKLLLRHYHKHIDEECRRELVRNGLKDALADQKPEPETVPRIEDEDNLTCVPGEPFVFSVSFDVPPQFELPSYKGITVSREDGSVEDSRVDEAIDGWLQQRSSYAVVERPSQTGDLVKASYEAKLEEEIDLPETSKFYLSTHDTWIALRQPELIPGTAEKLVGMVAGESREVDIVFPESFTDAALAGKKAHYTFTVAEVHGLEQPELTDELAQSAGAGSVEDMRERVKRSLENEQKQRQNRAVREQILGALLGNLTIPLPPTRARVYSYNTLMRLYDREMRGGQTPEQLGPRQEELRQQADREAQRDLRRYYLLQRIAEEEGIETDEDRVNDIIQYMAAMNQVTPKVMIRRLRENGRLDELVTSVREEQVMDRLIELSNIVGNATEQE